MIISSAHLFAKQITAGEVPPATPFYWRYTPPGYIDGIAPYLRNMNNWYYDNPLIARGLGKSSIQSATDDMGTGATKIDDPSIYPSPGTRDYNYEIPFYDDTTGELSDWKVRIGLRYNADPTEWTRFGLNVMLYHGNDLVGNSASGISNDMISGATKDFEYYLFGGAGRMWNRETSPFTCMDDVMYICVAMKCKNNNDDIEFAYAPVGVNLGYMKETYNVIVSDDYFKGNNDNPDYPPTT